jgi:hypothetical protein
MSNVCSGRLKHKPAEQGVLHTAAFRLRDGPAPALPVRAASGAVDMYHLVIRTVGLLVQPWPQTSTIGTRSAPRERCRSCHRPGTGTRSPPPGSWAGAGDDAARLGAQHHPSRARRRLTRSPRGCRIDWIVLDVDASLPRRRDWSLPSAIAVLTRNGVESSGPCRDRR